MCGPAGPRSLRLRVDVDEVTRPRGALTPATSRRQPAQACGCLVAKIAAWVRLVSPSLASIEET